MANLSGFNATNVTPGVGFEPIPPGRYLATITASGMKPSKSGGGDYLELTFELIAGAYKGRKVWARLSLRHHKPTVCAMAERELSAVCHAVGVLKPSASEDLHDLPLAIVLVVKPRDDGGGDANKIVKYEVASPEEVAAADQDDTGEEIPV